MTSRLELLTDRLRAALGDSLLSLKTELGEITIEVADGGYMAAMHVLRDDGGLQFDQLIDLCGVDYSDYADGSWQGRRFAAVSHLLSLANNWRVRVRVFASDDAYPRLASVAGIWPSADWFEREAFDLFGVLFDGHPDLRRILTDYGFDGHPFRKDFPVSGYTEMRYDESQKRVVYQPVTIDLREITPRVRREEHYGEL